MIPKQGGSRSAIFCFEPLGKSISLLVGAQPDVPQAVTAVVAPPQPQPLSLPQDALKRFLPPSSQSGSTKRLIRLLTEHLPEFISNAATFGREQRTGWCAYTEWKCCTAAGTRHLTLFAEACPAFSCKTHHERCFSHASFPTSHTSTDIVYFGRAPDSIN